MKRFLFILLGFSLLFFSCASKPDSEVSEMGIQESDVELNNSDKPEQKKNSEILEETISESTSDNSDELNSKVSEGTYIDEESYLKELEELSDPDVTDVEYTEPEVSENETNSSPENFELISQDETVPDTATNVETIETKVADSTSTTDTGNTELKKENKESASENQEDDEIIDLTESNSPEDIIEILDENSDSTPEEIEPVIIIPSRKVTLKIGQTLEVMYPGSGWIYLGTTDRTKDFTFLGKKLGTQNTKFTFTAKAEGTKILHFYKNDSLTEKYIDDYLEVEISNQEDSAKAIIPAPAYKQPVPKKEPKKIEVQQEEKAAVKNVTSQSNSNPPVISETKKTAETPEKPAFEEKKTESKPAEQKPSATQTNEKTEQTSEIMSEKEVNDLLKQAHTYFDNKDYKNAMNKLSQFLEYGTKNRDEAFYLQGQIYEASGSTKNIKLAIDSYKNVINNYPASPFWDDANKRIIYLTKFYLEGR